MKATLRAMSSTALVVFLSICVTAQKSQPSSPSHMATSGIDLHVVDPSGYGIPIANVIITNEGGEEVANGFTDRLGKFSVSQVSPGAYEFTIVVGELPTYAKTMLVQEHAVAEFTITLPVEPIIDTVRHGESALDLIVKDESGAVIANAGLSIAQAETGAKVYGRTNQAGMFHAGDLAYGKYTLMVQSQGFRSVRTIIFAVREPHEFTITLPVATTIDNPPGPMPGVETQSSTLDSELLLEPRVPPAPPNPPSQQKPKSNRITYFFSTLVT